MSDQADSRGSRRKYRRRRSRNRLTLVVAIVLLVVLAAIALLGLGTAPSAGEIPRGVQAGGIDLGGKSTGEAKHILQKRAYALNEIHVSGDGKEVTIPASSLGVHPDVAATVKNAQQVGRTGNVFERARERASGVFGTVKVPLKVAYDDQKVRSQTQALAQQLDKSPTQATVAVSAGGVATSPSSKGYEVNVKQTAANIRSSIENLDGEAKLVGSSTKPEITTSEAQSAAKTARTALGGPAVLTAKGQEWRLMPQQLAAAVSVQPRDGKLQVNVDPTTLKSDLSSMYSSVDAKAKEASYRFAGNGVEVVPGQIGRRIQTQKLMNQLQTGLPKGQRQYDVPVVDDKPQLTTQEAQRQRPTQMIGEYRTTFLGTGDNEPARVQNLKVASQGLTGQTVAPGEVFSTNDVLAPLDYKKTKVFLNGAVKKALGGGLCQVASTLYMAVNYAGLQPVDRHPHYALLNYIRPGLDATVWFGAANGYSGKELDMKFKNTSDGYVMIREHVENDGYIYAEIWGQPTGKQVTMDSKNLVENKQKSVWTTTKTIKNAQGKTLFSGNIHTDTYYALETKHGKLPPDEVKVAPVNP